jgi:succinate dehydrogenase / fumarate reductase cytochrome b subunit
MTTTSKRPVFLNLWHIKLPISGVVSIAHRLSGVVLILSLPFAVHLFEHSLSGPQGFVEAAAVLSHPVVQLLLLLLTWSLLHHLFAGIRYLLVDFDLRLATPPARRSAWIALGGAILVAPVIWGLLR